MILAAERIVAEQGLPAMTLRKVQEAAGQANKTAAQYHFGSREGLIAAVIEARMGSVDANRREMLDAIDSDPVPGDIRTLAEALILPLADATVRRPGSYYARFLAQAILDPRLATIAREHLRIASFLDVFKRLQAATDFDAEDARWRVEHVVTLTTYTLARWENGERDPDTVVTQLVDACVALLVSSSTR